MYELLVPVLVFVSVLAVGGAVFGARAARATPLRARLGLATDELATQQEAPTKSRLSRMLERIGRKVSAGGPSPALRQELARAGYSVTRVARLYLGAKMVLLVLGLAGSAMLVVSVEWSPAIKGFVVVTCGTLLSFVPNVLVHLRRRKRRIEIRHHLPDALDLLEVSVSSGMGLDTAWNCVADEIRDVSTILANEMALTNLELHLGTPRAEAMRHMAERTGAQEITSLVSVLVQSERFGTSIAEALRTFAETMRESRSNQAEVAAEKMAVKLLFPLIVFIFPAILVVTVGPAVVIIVDIFSGD